MRTIRKIIEKVILGFVEDQFQPEVSSSMERTRAIRDVSCHLQKITNKPKTIYGIVFSMDRAMQLHALLSSYKDLVINQSKLYVLYYASNIDHDEAYNEVFRLFPDLNIITIKQVKRDSFKRQLIGLLEENKDDYLFFLVDDNLFVENIDLIEFAAYSSTFCTPSMRLGYNLTHNYTLCKEQSKPTFLTLNNDYVIDINHIKSMPEDLLLCWSWDQGKLDWSYPLTVDGNIFLREEILSIVKSIEFDSPNTFESQLQIFNSLYKPRLGICYKKSRLINIPCNRVQSDFENIHGSIHQDWLLKKWQEGLCIDRIKFYGYKNISAHQEIPITFCERK